MLKSNSPNSCELKNPNANQFYKFLIVPDSPQLESGLDKAFLKSQSFICVWQKQ